MAKNFGIWILALIVAMVCAGCNSTPPNAISGRVLIPSDSLYNPQDFIVAGEYLAIIDQSIKAVQLYNRHDGGYIRKFGQPGQGPGEFSGIWSINRDYAETNAFWIFDISLYRLTKCVLGKEYPAFMINLQGGAPIDPIVVGNSLILSPGFALTKGRLAVYDSTGRLVREAGPIPGGRPENVPVPVHLQAYHATAKLKPDQSRLVLATRYADLIEIYTTDGTLIKKVSGPLKSLPVYEVDLVGHSPVMVMNYKKTPLGYIDVDATDDFIFALFSGRWRHEHRHANFAEYVHIYDWGGNLVQIIKLDYDARKIAVDERGERLYTYRENPSPAIIEYEIPQSIK